MIIHKSDKFYSSSIFGIFNANFAAYKMCAE